MIFPPINQIPFTTLHELNMDWLLNELVTRFNAVVQQFNQIVEQFNKLSEQVDNLEADYTQFKQETEELLKQIELIADKLNPETIDELLSLVDDFDKVQTALDKLQTDLAAEESARTAADTTLQAAIDKEVTDRTAADNTLQAAIDKEVTDRTAADNTLQAAIDKEVTDRTAADKTLQDQIDSLTEGGDENAGAIGNLRDELAAEKAAREAGDSALQTAINKEVTDRTTAVNSLQTEIGTLTTAIQDETKARTDADSLLQTGISGNATNITNLTSRVASLENTPAGSSYMIKSYLKSESPANQTGSNFFNSSNSWVQTGGLNSAVLNVHMLNIYEYIHAANQNTPAVSDLTQRWLVILLKESGIFKIQDAITKLATAAANYASITQLVLETTVAASKLQILSTAAISSLPYHGGVGFIQDQNNDIKFDTSFFQSCIPIKKSGNTANDTLQLLLPVSLLKLATDGTNSNFGFNGLAFIMPAARIVPNF